VKRRRLFIIIFGCLAAAILVLLVWPREREPQYNGVTLSTWLVCCGSTNYADSLAAVDAIRHIGTNALPFLIRWIQYEPGWKDSLGRKILGWPVIGNRRDVQKLIWNMTQYRANTAVNGFKILGSDANPTLPELQRMADNSKAPETAIRATQCLIYMTQAFPGRDYFDGVRVR
jgi:hypothetical protein